MNTKINLNISEGKSKLEVEGTYKAIITELAFVFTQNQKARELFEDALTFSKEYIEKQKNKTPEHSAHKMALDTLEATIKNGNFEAVKDAHATVTSMHWDTSNVALYDRYVDLLKRALEKQLN